MKSGIAHKRAARPARYQIIEMIDLFIESDMHYAFLGS